MTPPFRILLLPFSLLVAACGGSETPSNPAASGGSGGSSGGSAGTGGGGMVPAPSELVGWAAVAGLGQETTTGGEGGETVRPTTVAELLAYGVSPDPLIIELAGTFDAPRVELLSNKTLVGVAGGATINGGI